LPELRKGGAEEFIRVLTLVSALMLALPLLSSITPVPVILLPSFWAVSLGLDLYMTHRFYRQNPLQFRRLERNRFFGFLVEKLGFPAATATFISAVEIPFAGFLAFILIPQVHIFISGLHAEPYVYFSSALGVTGFTHLQAALRNHMKEREAERRKRFNETPPRNLFP